MYKISDNTKLLQQRGFTMTELITIIVIVGILAVAALPRFFDSDAFSSRGFRDQVISTLRYAQKTAIAQHRFVCVGFSTDNVALTWGVDSSCAGGALTMPSGGTGVSNANVAITAPAAGNISFDCLGRPRKTGNALATCVPGNHVDVLAATQTVGISGATDIKVEPETGYVH